MVLIWKNSPGKSFNGMELKLNKALVFFDLETTGTNILSDRIIEIAAIRIEVDGTETKKEWRLNPGIPIPPDSTAIHGISDADVAGAPSFEQMSKEIFDFFKNCDLGGYNHIKFDIPVLIEEFARVDMEFSLKNRRLLDAQRIFFKMEPRTLSAAYRFYCDKKLDNAHSAMADTEATLEVLMAQIERYKDYIPDGENKPPVTENLDDIHNLVSRSMVDLAGRIVLNDKKEKVFNFGKHKGKRIADVFAKEPSYYDWMMRGDFPTDTKRHLTEIKLSMSKML
jgi:DNA polymerase-3 subunit epsilon